MGVMRPTVVADKFVNPTIQLLALLLLAVLGWTGGEQLVWTRVLGFIAVAVIAVPWLIRLLKRFPKPEGETFRETWIPSRSTFAEFWRFTVPRAFGQIAQVGIQRVDIVLVALWLSPSEAAVYAAATRFLVFGQLAANAIGTAVQPRISTLSARGEIRPLQDLYRTSTAWVMFATWPLYLTFLVHAEALMRVFGEQYVAGAQVLQILSAAMLVATACGAVDAVLLMAGRSTLTMINAWIALVVNIALNIWLIPQLGILGAALAWVAAILVNNLLPLIQVGVVIKVHPFGRITLLAAAVPAVLFGLIPWLTAMLNGGVVGGIVVFALACLVYALLLWRWKDALGLRGLLRRSPGGRPPI
jgi:O-antigen/teichoic acid export membrane protein